MMQKTLLSTDTAVPVLLHGCISQEALTWLSGKHAQQGVSSKSKSIYMSPIQCFMVPFGTLFKNFTRKKLFQVIYLHFFDVLSFGFCMGRQKNFFFVKTFFCFVYLLLGIIRPTVKKSAQLNLVLTVFGQFFVCHDKTVSLIELILSRLVL